MALHMLEASAEDIPGMTAVFASAIHQDNAVDRIMFPKGWTQGVLETTHTSFRENMKSDESQYFKIVFKSVVQDSGDSEDTGERIVAFAKWLFYLNDRRDTDGAKSSTNASLKNPMGPPEDVNYEVANMIMGNSAETKKKHIKEPCYVYLSMLATHPKYQGLGAASKLIQHGINVGEQHGLSCWLQSTPSAHIFYQKHGYEDVASKSFDFSQYADQEESLREPYIQTLMRRRPQSTKH